MPGVKPVRANTCRPGLQRARWAPTPDPDRQLFDLHWGTESFGLLLRMPFEIIWSEREAHKCFSGQVSGEEYVRSVQDVRSDLRFPNLKIIINDFSRATVITIERLAMLYAASLTSAAREKNADVRVAFVVPQGPVGADVREVLAPLVVPRYKFRVFDTTEEAKNWE